MGYEEFRNDFEGRVVYPYVPRGSGALKLLAWDGLFSGEVSLGYDGSELCHLHLYV